MAGIVRGRDGARIVPGEFFFFPQVMDRVDAIAAESDAEQEEACS